MELKVLTCILILLCFDLGLTQTCTERCLSCTTFVDCSSGSAVEDSCSPGQICFEPSSSCQLIPTLPHDCNCDSGGCKIDPYNQNALIDCSDQDNPQYFLCTAQQVANTVTCQCENTPCNLNICIDCTTLGNCSSGFLEPMDCPSGQYCFENEQNADCHLLNLPAECPCLVSDTCKLDFYDETILITCDGEGNRTATRCDPPKIPNVASCECEIPGIETTIPPTNAPTTAPTNGPTNAPSTQPPPVSTTLSNCPTCGLRPDEDHNCRYVNCSTSSVHSCDTGYCFSELTCKCESCNGASCNSIEDPKCWLKSCSDGTSSKCPGESCFDPFLCQCA